MCFDSGSSKQKSQNIVQSTAPYGPAQPNIDLGLADTRKLYESGGLKFQPYQGPQVAPTSGETSQSWKMLTDQAMAGDPGVRAATEYDTKLLRGDVSALTPVLNSARDAINANKSLSGRYGSDVHDRGITEGLGTIIANAQGQAAGRAPGLATAGYLPGQIMGGVGSQVEAAAQDQINALMRQFQTEQEEPANAIQRLLDLSSGNWGGSSYSQQPIQKTQAFNPWATGLATAASLAGSYLSS